MTLDYGLIAENAVAPIIRGFDPTGRFWVVARGNGGYFSPVPPLDGTLVTDPVSLAEIADALGYLVRQMPLAVLRPGSVNDVRAMINFARQHGLRIIGCGNGDSVCGRTRVETGIVVDVGSLNQIHAATTDGRDREGTSRPQAMKLSAGAIRATALRLTERIQATSA